MNEYNVVHMKMCDLKKKMNFSLLRNLREWKSFALM